MDIQDLNPSQVSSEDAIDIGRMLVDLNTQGMEYIQGIIVGPSIDNVMSNEGDYSKIYKPIIQRGRDYVTQNQLALQKIDADILSGVNRQIAVNTGQVTNFIHSLRGTTNANQLYGSGQYGFIGGSSKPIPTNAIGDQLGSTGPISSITGQLPNMPQSGGIPIGNGSTGIGPIGQIPSTQVTIPIGQNPTTDIGNPPTAIGQSPQFGSQPIQGIGNPPPAPVGQGISPTGATFGCTGITAVYGGTNNGDGTYTCPAGTMPHYNANDCTVTCVPIPGYQPPSTQPPTNQQCYVPPPVIPPKPILPPPCQKPSLPCPVGYDWWLNPATNLWQCTTGGNEPKPLPPAKPIIPDCQTIVDRLMFTVPLSCQDLPKEFRDRMTQCGFEQCGGELSNVDPEPKLDNSEWDMVSGFIHKLTGWKF